MKFEPGLKKGTCIDNLHLMDIFGCGARGGMRRSLSTNSLVLISNTGGKDYKDIWVENDTWHFTGMGRVGDQDLNYSQNKTLMNSNRDKVQLYLFQYDIKKQYRFIGKVLLAGPPVEAVQENYTGNLRKVYIFPLIEVKKERDITEFLNEFDKETLINRGVIEYPINHLTQNSYIPLIDLMKEKKIYTLTSPGGFFLNQKGFFNNEYSSRVINGNIFSLIKENRLNASDIFTGQNKYINPFFKGSTVYDEESVSTLNDGVYQDNFEDAEYNRRKRKVIPKNIKKSNQIRIISLVYNNEITYNQILLTDGKMNMKPSRPYTTLFIGPNGAGKSDIISMIQKIFLDVYRLKISKKPLILMKSSYRLEYQINQTYYRIEKNENDEFPTFIKEDLKISIKELDLPSNVICCAFTLSDRFTPYDTDLLDIPEYEYFGIKIFSKQELVDSTTDMLVSNIMMASLKNGYIKNLNEITSFLDFEPKLKIKFRKLSEGALDEVLTPNNLILAQEKSTNNIKIDEKHAALMFRAMRMGVKSYSKLFTYEEDGITLTFDLNHEGKYYLQFFDEFQTLFLLEKLNIFYPPEILVCKKNEKDFFPLNEASSGEFQFISTMINIMTKIQGCSLVIIDEPETSLHPTWQSQYINTLYRIFGDFKSCHFLLATHSHFLVSDLEIGNSSIVTLTRDSNSKVLVKLLEEETYGRSVEDILYNVFNLTTTRNYYLAADLDNILLAVSTGEITTEIRDKVSKIRLVRNYLSETDPLKLIIDKLIEKVDAHV